MTPLANLTIPLNRSSCSVWMRRSVSAYRRIGLGADQVAHDVEIVRREVDHDADVPDPRRKRPEPRCLHLEDAAELAIGQAAAELTDGRVEALDVADGQHPSRRLGGGHHLERLVAGGGDRLLDEDVGARAESGHRDRQMQAGRRHDADEVELLLGQHPLRVLEAAGTPSGRGACRRPRRRDPRRRPARRPSTASSQTRTWLRPIMPSPTTPARSGRGIAHRASRLALERAELGGRLVHRADDGRHLVVGQRRVDRDAEHLFGEPVRHRVSLARRSRARGTASGGGPGSGSRPRSRRRARAADRRRRRARAPGSCTGGRRG